MRKHSIGDLEMPLLDWKKCWTAICGWRKPKIAEQTPGDQQGSASKRRMLVAFLTSASMLVTLVIATPFLVKKLAEKADKDKAAIAAIAAIEERRRSLFSTFSANYQATREELLRDPSLTPEQLKRLEGLDEKVEDLRRQCNGQFLKRIVRKSVPKPL